MERKIVAAEGGPDQSACVSDEGEFVVSKKEVSCSPLEYLSDFFLFFLLLFVVILSFI